jgi:hypothetical protein
MIGSPQIDKKADDFEAITNNDESRHPAKDIVPPIRGKNSTSTLPYAIMTRHRGETGIKSYPL